MDVEQLFRRRVGLAAAAIGTILVLVLLREAAGLAVGNTTGWRSWYGLISGLLGATAMVTVVGVLVEIDAEDLATFRQIQYVHVVYGTVAGGLYPAVVTALGFDAAVVTDVPRALLGGLGYTVGLFAFGMVVYALVGAVRTDREGLEEAVALFGLYLLYGVVFGVSLSLSGPVWSRLFAL